jgi:hypothetical protein
MSKAEARQHFASAHLYWHGPDHCWDATPGRHRVVRKNQPSDRQVERGRGRSDWRQAMSEMLPGDGPVQAPVAQTAGGAAAAVANWLDRWIDIAQVVPRVQTERPSEPTIASPVPVSDSESGGLPHVVVVLAFFAFLLIFATIEILFRNDEQQK